MITDTHVHLDDEKLRGELQEVIERATNVAVQRMICIATDAASSNKSIEYAQKWNGVYASVGIHPNYGHEAQPDDWNQIVELAGKPRVVAVGETGLDRHWNYTPFTTQQEFFRLHLALSRKTGLPLVIHCREAETDMLEMLTEDYNKHGLLHGVMHSFSGDQPFADACLRLGLYISFAGMVTYKNAHTLREVAAMVPDDRILVETDAPYLTPEPLRGKVKKNEPGHIVHTVERLAVIRNTGLNAFAQQTSANAESLFRFHKGK